MGELNDEMIMAERITKTERLWGKSRKIQEKTLEIYSKYKAKKM